MENALKIKSMLEANKLEIMSFSSSTLRQITGWGRITDGRIEKLKSDCKNIGIRFTEGRDSSYSINIIDSPTGEIVSICDLSFGLSESKLKQIQQLSEVYQVFLRA